MSLLYTKYIIIQGYLEHFLHCYMLKKVQKTTKSEGTNCWRLASIVCFEFKWSFRLKLLLGRQFTFVYPAHRREEVHNKNARVKVWCVPPCFCSCSSFSDTVHAWQQRLSLGSVTCTDLFSAFNKWDSTLNMGS